MSLGPDKKNYNTNNEKPQKLMRHKINCYLHESRVMDDLKSIRLDGPLNLDDEDGKESWW